MTAPAPDPHGQVATMARRQSDGDASSAMAVIADPARTRAIHDPRPTWAEQQELIDLKLQIVKQQGKLDALCSRLSHCETANEALRAEKAILDDQLALDMEIIDALKRENQLLRRQQGKRPGGSDTSSTSSSSESDRHDLVGIDLICRPIDRSQYSRSTLERTVGASEVTDANKFGSSIGERKAIAKLTRRRSSATVPQRRFPFARGSNEKPPPSTKVADKNPLPFLAGGADKEPVVHEQTRGPFGSEVASAGEERPAKQDPPAKQDSITGKETPVARAKLHKGLRQDYSLGDALRSYYHMVVEPTSERAVEAVDSLQKHDFAFVKRSGGSHSYATVAGRECVENKDGEAEECIIFVINSEGSTKTVRRRHWSQSVHLIKVGG